jgi:hypothetical protein
MADSERKLSAQTFDRPEEHSTNKENLSVDLKLTLDKQGLDVYVWIVIT